MSQLFININYTNVLTMKKKVIFIITMLFFQLNHSQQYPTVTEDRPRINISNDRFNEIRSLISPWMRDNRPKQLFQVINDDFFLNYTCNNSFGFNLCGPQVNWSWEWFSCGNNTPCFKKIKDPAFTTLEMILLYYNISQSTNDPLGIDKNLQKERINYITIKFLEYIDDFYDFYGHNNIQNFQVDRYDLSDGFRSIAKFGSILLDWGYESIDSDVFSPNGDLRNELVNKLFDVNFDFMNHFVYFHIFDNEYFAGGHALQNNMLNMKMVLSLYHSDELIPEKQDKLQIRYRFIYDNLTNEFIPIFKYYGDDNNDGNISDNEGGIHWGATYSRWARQYFTEFFDLITHATNKNLYVENLWTNNYINHYFYLEKPDKSTLHLGDDIVQNVTPDLPVISLFNRFNHQKNKWMMKKYEEQSTNVSSVLKELLFRDFSIASQSPSNNPYNLSWFARKTGIFVRKSDYTDNATMVTFFNSPTNRNNHQHLDNNSFQIYKNGPLFVNSGAYDSYLSSHFLNYYFRTISHNTITIFDPDESFFHGNSTLSNDGGQLIKPILKNYNEIISDHNLNYSNSWPVFTNNENYTYFISDATSSFSSNKLNSYLKKVLYIKPLDRLIIMDLVDQPLLNNQKIVKWNAHFVNRPMVFDDNGYEAVFECLIGQNIVRFNNNERNIYVTNSDNSSLPSGNAKIKVLLPFEPEITLVGGENYEHFVYGDIPANGENHPPTSSLRSEGANWRMEIRNTSTEPTPKETIFLHTIQIGDNNLVANNGSMLLSNTNNTISIKWDNSLYFFSSSFNTNPNTSHIVDITNLSQDSHKLYAYDLIPAISYDIKINNSTIFSLYSDANGILETPLLSIVGNTLAIVPSSNIISTKTSLLKIYPNTIERGDLLNILLEVNENDRNNLKIYDINNRIVLHDFFVGKTHEIPNLKLQSGLYIIKVTSNNKVFESKLIVK